MKRLFLAVFLLWGSVVAFAQSNVTLIEVFFDTDPGVGLAAQFVPGTPGPTIDEMIVAGADTLTPGFHILGVRVQTDYAGNPSDTVALAGDPTDRQWSLTEFRAFTVSGSSNAVVENIIEVEYFVDNDPGYGFGTPFTVTPATTIDITELATADTLAPGFHILGVRVQDENNTWSLTEYRAFNVSGSNNVAIEDIIEAEYFVDNDPGYGSGTPFTVTPGATIDITELVTADTLIAGFHVLGVRVQDANNTWSITEYRAFNVSGSNHVVIEDISAAEYFVDDDPGYGSGTPFTVTPGATIDITELVTADTLTAGFHVVGVRVQDVNNTWSITEYRAFNVSGSSNVVVEDITSAEYFVDDDPGHGLGTAFTITPGATINITELVTADTLTDGFHVVGVRVQDANNTWSLTEYRAFVVSGSNSVVTENIVNAEYFVDDDPGYGSGIPFTVTPGVTVDITELVTADTLSFGFHVVGIRVQDENNTWSLPEYRPFYIATTGPITIDQIDSVEWFIDAEPGVGNGTFITVIASDSINLNTTLTADTLSLGFHTVAFRVKDVSGSWSHAEYRPFYVSATDPLNISPITTLEYFYDVDPGFDNATQIPVSGDSIELSFNVPPPASPGTHYLTIRVKNADGEWSLGEGKIVYSLDPGRELDSLALVELYNKNNGPSWNNSNNWLFGDLDTWYGVYLSSGRVDSLYLAGNGLTGKLPKEFSYITDLRRMVLSNNSLVDSLPYQIPTYMSQLRYVDVADNQLNGLPNLFSIGTMDVLITENNFFDFGDLEPNAAIPTFTYSPQGLVTQPFDSLVNVGQLMDIGITMGGVNNNYQWFKEGSVISGANANAYIIPFVNAIDSGSYYCEIDNSLLPGLVLSTDIYRLFFSSFTNDSLALVSLYNSTAGPGWTTGTNWLTGNVDTWYGVNVINGNVRSVDLTGNNLTGNIPDDIFYLDSVDVMVLSGNNLTGYIPGTMVEMDNLRRLNISSNAIDSLPALNLSPKLDTLYVSDNRLEFNHLEVNLAIPEFIYAPQDSAGTGGYILVDAGTNYTFVAGVGGGNNIYQWFKNGTTVGGATSANFTLANLAFSNEGYYTVRVRNTIVPALDIYTKVTELRVSSLQRDSVALVTLYQTTGGNNWTDKTGWDETSRGPLDTWVGVVIGSNRIKKVILPDNNLDGQITDKIRDITQLEVLNVSGNRLYAIPFMASMAVLDTLDVSRNQLVFEELIPNLAVPNYIYNPQDSLLGNSGDTISVGTDYQFTAVSKDPGNSYAWFLNGQQISGASDSTYTINGIQRNTMGSYFAQITNPAVSDLDLFTKPATVLAKATVSGIVTDPDDNPVESGEMRIFKITDIGGFDTTNLAPIGTGGAYTLTDVVLDDYVLVADADDGDYPDLVPSYFGNTIYWEEADTIPLTDDITQIDIKFVGEPSAGAGTGSIFGTVEEDLEGGRVEARRKLGRATVSATRTAGGGRHQREFYHYRMNAEELAAVTISDDQGEFALENLEPGFYRLNVQYPGIPMDQESDVILEVTSPSGRHGRVQFEDVEVAALVTPTAIVVDQLNVPVGLGEHWTNKFNVYPVPASDQLVIESLEYNPESNQLSIVNMNGKEMMDKPLTLSGRTEVDVRQYQTGMYILRIIPENAGEPVEIARILITR